MSEFLIRIPCPACGKELKLRDASFLGKRGQCPKCEHSFVLQVAAIGVVDDIPAPTTPDPFDFLANPKPKSNFPDFLQPAPTHNSPTPSGPASPSFIPGSAPFVEIAGEPVAQASIAQTQKKKLRQGRWSTIAALALFLGFTAGVGAYLYNYQQQQNTIAAQSIPAVASPKEIAPSDAISAEYKHAFASPTTGQPLSMKYLPAGGRILVAIRPAELWKAESLGEEVRYCLGPLGEHLATQVKALTMRDPTQIEEILISLIPGERGQFPELACVYRLVTPARRTDLYDEFSVTLSKEYGEGLYVNQKLGRVYAIGDDLRTIAYCPVSMASELVSSITQPLPVVSNLESLLKQTDQSRHFTLLVDKSVLEIDGETLVPSTVFPWVMGLLDWVGEGIESALWSLHLADDRVYSEVLLRTRAGAPTQRIEDLLRERLTKTPLNTLETLRQMTPQHQGRRQLIGRLPAMLEGVRLASQLCSSDRAVRILTALPERAAPNLAIASVLAWDESTRTRFESAKPGDMATAANGPTSGSLLEKLQTKLDVDFRRTPLQEAIQFVADESKAKFDIDGDALKFSGLTKNMPVQYAKEQITAAEALAAIFKIDSKLCVVAVEKKQMFLVTTTVSAEQKNLKPVELPKPVN